MLGRSRRLSRVLFLGVVLTLASAACEINVQLVTKVEADGAGNFSLRFLIDKELADLARASGEDPFQALACPENLEKIGWTCTRSTEGGGIAISLDRSFRSANEFNTAMEQLEKLAAEQEGPTADFFKLRIKRDSGFLRSKTIVEGSVDLTSSGVLGNASEETQQTLEGIIQQAAGEFFTFRLQADLPGKVSRTSGDPEKIEGGTATWTPRLGRSLSFSAESAAYNAPSVALVGVPVVILIVLVALRLIRRRRRNKPEPTPLA